MPDSKKLEERKGSNESFEYTMSLIGGKWKLHILFILLKEEVMRYGELKKSLQTITHKMLSNQLKELERDALIIRKEYAQVPPKVEYTLSKRGQSLMPALQELCQWGVEHIDDGV
ncbi:helix-turn-helix domain-containing protein [Mammaliicoccus sp. Dog046]|uniref:winged helix-turn-helix transcriptional regulator n=1 Tax=Mammaliicoccus sp. Dog046 TaxID=3034233 RepID=UPI002B262A9D|nr:helix-turn-helix domain-containing protein [Mammaliicoccus sp. Dog046]WQK85574.1 helix-turn-helix domain-containing protein [Mammaliicoccus sp. Dog046]